MSVHNIPRQRSGLPAAAYGIAAKFAHGLSLKLLVFGLGIARGLATAGAGHDHIEASVSVNVVGVAQLLQPIAGFL